MIQVHEPKTFMTSNKNGETKKSTVNFYVLMITSFFFIVTSLLGTRLTATITNNNNNNDNRANDHVVYILSYFPLTTNKGLISAKKYNILQSSIMEKRGLKLKKYKWYKLNIFSHDISPLFICASITSFPLILYLSLPLLTVAFSFHPKRNTWHTLKEQTRYLHPTQAFKAITYANCGAEPNEREMNGNTGDQGARRPDQSEPSLV